MLYEGLIQRANDRARRRFKAMLSDFFDSGSWDSALYLEADRLVERLEDRGLTEIEPGPDATNQALWDDFEVPHTKDHDERGNPNCQVCCDDNDFFARYGYHMPEGEARAMWGNR